MDCVDCLFGESTTPGTVFFHFRFVDDDGATAFVCELQLCLGQLVVDDWRATAAFDAYRSAREFLIATGKGDLVDAVESEERKSAAASEAPAPAPPKLLPRGGRCSASRAGRATPLPGAVPPCLNAVAAALGRRGSVQPAEDSDDDDEPVLEAEAPPAHSSLFETAFPVVGATPIIHPLRRARQHALVLRSFDILPLVSLRLAPTQCQIHFQEVLVVEIQGEAV